MALIKVMVTNWTDTRDSSYRKAPADGTYRNFVINPSHISELIVDPSSAAKSIFKYFDNNLDRREGYSKIKANVTVAALQTAADTAFDSNFITLPIHKYNNPAKATTNVTMPVEAFSYATEYNPSKNNHCWVVYYLAGFKRREVLVHLSLEDIRRLSATGSTSDRDV
jgi:hypothetical protein